MSQKGNPIGVRVKNDKVTLTFNAAGWTTLDTVVLVTLGRLVRQRGVCGVASYVSEAFQTKARCDSIERNGSDKSFKKFMDMVRIEAAEVNAALEAINEDEIPRHLAKYL